METENDRYPGFRRLRLRRRPRRVPFVQSLSLSDCGPACLCMVLRYYGKDVPLAKVSEVAGVSRDAVDLLTLLETARWFGLRGQGMRLRLDDLPKLRKGTILHWRTAEPRWHYVVFERLRRDCVDIVDPSFGPRPVPMTEFRQRFTGPALELEPAAEFRPGKSRTGGTWRYLKDILARPGVLARVLTMSVVIQVLSLALPVLTGALVDRVVPRGDYDLLTILSLGFGIIVIFHFLASFLRAHLLLYLQTNLDAEITRKFLDRLVDLPYSYFQRRAPGDLMLRLNSNATVREILTSGTLSVILDGTLANLYLILILLLSPIMGALAVLLALIRILVYLMAQRRYQLLMTESLLKQAVSQDYQVEMFAGMETLKAAGSEYQAVGQWSHFYVDTLNVNLARGRLNAAVDSVFAALQVASPLVILIVGGYLVLQESLTLGTMLAVNALAMGLLTPLSGVVRTALQLKLVRSYMERINDVLDTPPEQRRSEVIKAPQLAGGVSVRGVSFRYRKTESAPFVIRDVSLAIGPGQFIAIVGRSASGKSTLASLMLGLYRPDVGSVFYDVADLASLDLRSVRRQLGIVVQHPYLFGGTIRSCITLADPSLPIEVVREVARIAHIHDEIQEMGMQYDTVLLDGGASLSGGQRQRLALARALVHRPAILLLDEATSALDSVLERKIHRELERLECTRIVIAQRLATIVNADCIFVLDAGRIVEQGTHDDLMNREGLYRGLFDAQMNRSSPADGSEKPPGNGEEGDEDDDPPGEDTPTSEDSS